MLHFYTQTYCTVSPALPNRKKDDERASDREPDLYKKTVAVKTTFQDPVLKGQI